MAGDAAEAVLGFGRIDLLFDRFVKSPIEEHGVIVTTGAPFTGLGAHDVLHMFDGFPVELVVETGEVMDRGFPLFVSVLVAFAAKFGIHEEVRRDGALDVRSGTGWPEWAPRAFAFFLHGDWNDCGIDDALFVLGPEV